MGRIDRALQRAGDGQVTAIVGEHEEQFVPAWSLEADAAAGDGNGKRPTEVRKDSGSLLVAEEYPAIKGFNAEWRERLASGAERNNVLVEQYRRLGARDRQGMPLQSGFHRRKN